MATLEERVDYLERAIAHMPTLSQVEALIHSQSIDAANILTRLVALEAQLAGFMSDLQNLKNSIVDHEERIVDLETP